MRTPQLHLVREAVTREPDAGRYVHVTPRRLPPQCLDRIDRDLARRIAAELHHYDEAA